MLHMKTALLTAFIAIIFCLNAQAQSCLPAGITFSTQAEIDNFPINYPGCTVIEGYVDINGDGITNLDSLSRITAIDGNLWIYRSPALTSLQGLSNLVIVRGSVDINSNGSLENLTGLDNLQTIGGDLYISEDSALMNVDGLNSLTTIGLDADFVELDNLLNLDGMNKLETIGGT